MAIDLGTAEKQKETAAGPIPKGSMVKVKLEIRKPKTADPQDPAVTVFKSGLKGLDCEFTVVSGQFEGVRIWENLFLPPTMQTIQLTKGQEGACRGGFAKCRAIIEAARQINPEDPAGNRNINSWFDLHGLEIPVKIGIDKPKPGDLYINNNIAKVLTVADAEFQNVMGGGEVITDTPIPELPKPTGTATTTTTAPAAGGPPAWGQGQPAAGSPPASQAPPATGQTMNVPTWAK